MSDTSPLMPKTPMSRSDVLEIGQDDYLAVLKDYWIARLSWRHFCAAYGDLGSPSHDVRDAINDARLGWPFDYIVTLLVYDVILAMARLTDGKSRKNNSDRITLLTLADRLCEKLQATDEPELRKQLCAVRDSVLKLRNNGTVRNLRGIRDSLLAHRLNVERLNASYGEISEFIFEMSNLFSQMSPLFRATEGFADSIVDQTKPVTERFWKEFIRPIR